MITINDSQILNMQDDLKTFKRRAFPFATKATINGAAFKARSFAQENIRNNMIERNRFTVSSVRVEQSRTLDIRRQAATVGSIADYMEDQEFGATKTRKGKQGVPIATSYAAGQAQNKQPRTRLPRKPNTMGSIQLSKRRKKGSNRKQQNLIAIKQAAQSGNKYVFLDLGRTRGIFRVLGGKKKPRIKMVWSMSKRSVVVPKNPWLAPAVQRTQPEIPELYAKALRFQLKKHGLFRDR